MKKDKIKLQDELLRITQAEPSKLAIALETAIVHPSYANENSDVASEFERLEFLGDAVLQFLASREIYNRDARLSEGNMTAIRSALVRTESLALKAKLLGLDKVIRLGRGEEQNGGRDKDSILADAFEALLASLYISCGLECAKAVVAAMFNEELSSINSFEPVKTDYKSRLQIVSQRRLECLPQYRIIATDGPDHARIFTCEVFLADRLAGTGNGKSKKEAEAAAAKSALDAMPESDDGDEG